MGRAPCCGDHQGLTRGPWTAEEDQKLIHYVERHGLGNWRTLAKLAGLSRCGKSCRLRWKNYLRPDIKRGTFSLQEDLTIIRLHAILGNKWSAIASHLDGRTDNEIKHYWNTKLKKRLLLMGIDPVTHRSLPTPDHMLSPFIASSSSTVDLAALTAMAASWNISALIEAELNRLATELSQNEKPLGTLKNPLVPPVSWPAHPTGADSTSSDETSLLLPSETSMDQLLPPQNQITQGFVPEQKDPIELYNAFSQDSLRFSSDVQEIRNSELGNGHMMAEERLLAVDTEITRANERSSGKSTSSNLDKGGSRILENTIPYEAEIGSGAESMWQAAGVTDNEDESNSWLNLLDFMENSMS